MRLYNFEKDEFETAVNVRENAALSFPCGPQSQCSRDSRTKSVRVKSVFRVSQRRGRRSLVRDVARFRISVARFRPIDRLRRPSPLAHAGKTL